jgi:hypothetical protein
VSTGSTPLRIRNQLVGWMELGTHCCALKILGAYSDAEVGDWGDTKYPLNYRTSELPIG